MPKHRNATAPEDGAPRPGSRRRRWMKRIALGTAVLLLAVGVTVFVAYRHLEGNITSIDISGKLGKRPEAVKVEGPSKPFNVLLMGSDTRAGANGKGIGGKTPGLSDTTILLHVSANRKFAYGVSLPRDAIVRRPSCLGTGNGRKGENLAPALTQFNEAYADGGPACTVKTVEQLTGVRLDHFVVVDFVGFRAMVDALNGVKVCVPEDVNDDVGHINLKAGTYTVTGEQALDYVRVRHGIGISNGDIGRMKRQQTFVAAMVNKVVSAGTLANPVRLYRFLDAATKSLTTDAAFSNLRELASVGSSLSSIGLDRVRFLTVPFEEYQPDPNRLQWAPSATRLWTLIRDDKPLGPRFLGDTVNAAQADPSGKPGKGSGPKSGSSSASPGGSGAGTKQPSNEQRTAEDRANGLCT